MTTQRRSGWPASAALFGMAFVLLASSCGQSTSAKPVRTPFVAPSPPPGGPVPAQLLGEWLLPAAATQAYVEPTGFKCPKPLAVASCMYKLTFTATTYRFNSNIPGELTAGGDAVVNGTEIDVFNGSGCGLDLPEGVGRYTWTLTGGILHFTSLNHDPCPRGPLLADQSYSRTG